MFENLFESKEINHEETLYRIIAKQHLLINLLVSKEILAAEEVNSALSQEEVEKFAAEIKDGVKMEIAKMRTNLEKDYKDGKISFVEYMLGVKKE